MKRLSTAYRFGARAKDKGSSSKSVRAVGSPGGDEQIRERRRSRRRKKMKKCKEEKIEMRKEEREMRESGGGKGRQVLMDDPGSSARQQPARGPDSPSLSPPLSP